MIDKSGVFEDFNFKLVVISELLNKNPSFEEELEKLKKEYVKNYEWYSNNGPIEEIIEFFQSLILTKEDIEKVTNLCFDGGEDIYFILLPDWDGEDDIFDVKSVTGFEELINLETVEYISMCDPEVLEPIKKRGINII